MIYHDDNLEIMKNIHTGSIHLIYIDPPFNTGRNFGSFYDRWTAIPTYLDWIHPRLIEIHRILDSTGSLFLHVDRRASHYLKVKLDTIFSMKCFRNEIIWCYRGGGVPKKEFAHKHDTILWYSKSPDTWTFNRDAVRIPYSEESQKRLGHLSQSFRDSGTYCNIQNPLGKHPDDWWEIQPIMPSEKIERVGYPTQKPIELMQRIIDACSDPGDLCADFFMGSGSFILAAAGVRSIRVDGKPQLKYYPEKAREYIGVDIGLDAYETTKNRIEKLVV